VERCCDEGLVLYLAFPERQDPPAGVFQHPPLSSVARHSRGELGVPEICTATRPRRAPASLVAVPKAAVHKHDEPMLSEDQIRSPRQVFPVEPKPEAQPVSKATNG